MARIRSVHPSLFTDEAWVSCSPLGRILYIGLWTDADDQGIFEWKPLQLKMRLLPGDMADVASLLGELVSAGLIIKFDHGGKPFGAIKGFRKFQRPKKPNSTHVLPAEFRTYVGLGDVGSDDGETGGGVVPNQFSTGGEISPQMEDGGGREDYLAIAKSDERSGDEPEEAVLADEPDRQPAVVVPIDGGSDHNREAWRRGVTVLTGAGLTEPKARSLFGKLLRDHALEAGQLLPSIINAERNGTEDPQGYLTAAARGVAQRAGGAPAVRPGVLGGWSAVDQSLAMIASGDAQ